MNHVGSAENQVPGITRREWHELCDQLIAGWQGALACTARHAPVHGAGAGGPAGCRGDGGQRLMADRGAEAYSQAYAYIKQENPDWPARECSRAAYIYLLVTASPPLTWREKRAARRAQRQISGN